MESWNQGYVSDVDYTYGFYRELAPTLLSFALVTKGFRPPAIEKPFTYCELGFGQGLSINIVSAANSHTGRFFGTDFNPTHAAGAACLASAANLQNIELYEDSFAELLKRDNLPQFDFITLHCVYSWISAENRKIITEFIRKKLKFGGVVYISYNSLPGWSAAMPLRELMIGHAAGSHEPTLKRVEKALQFAARVAEAKAGYFVANPGINARLEKLREQNPHYLAHEYFNRDWNPLYHAEVARELAEAKLVFAASANVGDNLDAIVLSPEAQKTLEEITDPVFRETVRDYFFNQQFRRDIFVKGPQRLTAYEQQDLLGKTRFTLLVHPDDFKLQANIGIGEVNLQPDVYLPLRDFLGKKPQTLDELLQNEPLKAIGKPRLIQAMLVLVASGQAAPCLPAENEEARAAVCKRFNDHILERSRFSDAIQYLASPVTGSGVYVNRFERLFLLGMSKGARELAQFAWMELSAQGQRLVRDGKVLESAEENIAELEKYAATFTEKSLYTLRMLKIV